MKKKYYITIFAFLIIVLSVFTFTNNNKKGEKNKNIPEFLNEYDGKAFVNLYDENGNLVKKYSEEQLNKMFVNNKIYKNEGMTADFLDENGLIIDPTEDIVKEMSELSDSGAHNLFVFRSTKFNNNINLGGQNKTFYKPISMIVEPEEVFDSMLINILDSVGKKVGSLEIGYFQRGIKIPLVDFQDDAYSIQF
ncbi:hypothetical protein [Psychrobacillus sp. L4]|uniref:hypothetical protein n=1 Tax=Psychrobacillus sp. L4 TaxID=3236892 RepID=UPI0036F19555